MLLYCFHYDPQAGKYGIGIYECDPAGRTGDGSGAGKFCCCDSAPGTARMGEAGNCRLKIAD